MQLKCFQASFRRGDMMDIKFAINVTASIEIIVSIKYCLSLTSQQRECRAKKKALLV